MGERVVLDVARAVAQRLELGQPVGHVPARGAMKFTSTNVSAFCSRVVGKRRRGIVLEARRVVTATVIAWLPADLRVGARSAASSVMPAEHFGDVAHLRSRAPSRCSLPAMFIRQPRSPASSRLGAGRRDVGGLLGDDGVGDVGVFDAEGAAEAAADIGVAHFDEAQTLDGGEQPARLASRTPSSRSPEQES